jgi:hypothetical protein
MKSSVEMALLYFWFGHFLYDKYHSNNHTNFVWQNVYHFHIQETIFIGFLGIQ